MNTIERMESRPTQDSLENMNSKDYSIDLIHKSEQTELWNIKDSALSIYREKELYYTIIGNKRLSITPFENINDAIEDAKRTDLNRLVQLMGAITELTLELKANTKKENE